MGNINNWDLYHKVEGRTFDQLKQRLQETVNVPCTAVQWGEHSNGAPWVIVKLDRPAKGNIAAPKTDSATEVVDSGKKT